MRFYENEEIKIGKVSEKISKVGTRWNSENIFFTIFRFFLGLK